MDERIYGEEHDITTQHINESELQDDDNQIIATQNTNNRKV